MPGSPVPPTVRAYPRQPNPVARSAAVRLAQLNAAVRELSARQGAFVVSLDRHPVSSDPRLWDVDRLHQPAYAAVVSKGE